VLLSVSLTLPGTVRLDNSAADQDVGRIAVPIESFGTIPLRVTGDGPERVIVCLFPQGDRRLPSIAYMVTGETVDIHPLPPGTWELAVWAPGFRAVPSTAGAMVTAGAPSEPVVFSLEPHGSVRGTATTAGSRPVPVRRVTLKGNGAYRRLDAGEAPGALSFYDLAIAERDTLESGSFVFVDLLDGEYELTVEADGYESKTLAVAVTQGRAVELPLIRLKRRGRRR
jgi:hypothetical protein